MTWLDTLDICYGPVNTLAEAIPIPTPERGAIVVAEDGPSIWRPSCASRTALATLYREPLLGEHTAAILGRSGD